MSQTKAQLLDGSVVSVAFSAGSAAAPSVYYSADATTGVYFPGISQIAFSTGGTSRLSITSTGALSLGATTTNTGTAGQVLTSQGSTGAPTWTTLAGNDVTQAGNNAFTGANTFYNVTGQAFGTATSTQDGIILAGRAGGSTSLRVTLQPGTLTASRILTLPDVAGTVVTTGDTGTVTNTMLAGSIADTKLSTISTSGKVSGTAITSGDINTSGSITAINIIPSSSSVPTNGLYLPAANTLGLSTNSAARIQISSNGAFGLGATPSYGTAGQVLTSGGPSAAPTWASANSGDVTQVGNNAFTGANTFTNATGQIFRAAATQDGVLLRGRAGGTASRTVEIIPASLTASRVLTAPDVSGTIVTTGDTGSVTGTMIANDTIFDTDINSSAAIAYSKLAAMTAGRVLLGNATNVPTVTALSGDATVSSTGVVNIEAGVIDNANINASAAIAYSKLASLTNGNILVGNASNVATAVAMSGDITISNTGATAIGTGVIVNADISASAAIDYSKLASLTSGNILVGNASNVATSVAMSGDITISNTGATSIGTGVIVNADINASAAIAYSKLASLTSGNILVGNVSNVATAVAMSGDITISNTGATSIGTGVIVNADINASAAIDYSKLASLTSGNILVGNASNVATAVAMSGDITISNTGATAIGTGVIVNADINASAAIVDTKLATISTAGKVSNSATTATDANTASTIVARDASGNFNTTSINSGPLAGFRNLIINGNPTINQRAYVSGTATSGANQYTLDRWRVVTSGQNITFTTSANVCTVTAPAGGVEQVIEGTSITSGTHVLNWTGTASATVNGTSIAKGGTFTLTGGTNATLRFTSGTFTSVQIEAGSTATLFERRSYGLELALCNRYYWKGLPSTNLNFNAYAANACGCWPIFFPVPMRTTPTLSSSLAGSSYYACTFNAWEAPTPDAGRYLLLSTNADPTPNVTFGANDFLAASAEL